MATSVGGVLTGRGADLIILDDPLKPGDALSETQRAAVNEWYDNSLLSRLNNKALGCIIIIMQRLHQDDLVGHVLQQEDWQILSLPAIAEVEESHLVADVFGNSQFVRKPGDVLHPERESPAVLASIRRNVGEYNFSSQYQQNPTPRGGMMVKLKWLNYFTPATRPPQLSTTVQSWDTANKAGELNDFSVCTTWGQYGSDFYLLDVFRERLIYPDLKRKVVDLAKKWRANTILIEDKASGTQLIQDLRGKIHGLRGHEPPKGTDKIMRLHTQTPAFENGYVYLPKESRWLADYVNELTSFPGAKFDDQVDSTTQALEYMAHGSNLEMWRKLGRG